MNKLFIVRVSPSPLLPKFWTTVYVIVCVLPAVTVVTLDGFILDIVNSLVISVSSLFPILKKRRKCRG